MAEKHKLLACTYDKCDKLWKRQCEDCGELRCKKHMHWFKPKCWPCARKEYDSKKDVEEQHKAQLEKQEPVAHHSSQGFQSYRPVILNNSLVNRGLYDWNSPLSGEGRTEVIFLSPNANGQAVPNKM